MQIIPGSSTETGFESTTDYDVEIVIPANQEIYSGVQGNWGLSYHHSSGNSSYNFTLGVYRDGFSSDGYILEANGTRYKHQITTSSVDQTIRYEVRTNSVKVYKDNVLVVGPISLPSSGDYDLSSVHVGMGISDYDNLQTGSGRGRRPNSLVVTDINESSSSYVSTDLGTGTYTLEFWFKPNSDMTNKIIFQTGYPV